MRCVQFSKQVGVERGMLSKLGSGQQANKLHDIFLQHRFSSNTQLQPPLSSRLLKSIARPFPKIPAKFFTMSSHNPNSLSLQITTLPTLSDDDFHSLLRSYAKFKIRSAQTHETEHVPVFNNHFQEQGTPDKDPEMRHRATPDLLLLGDSMFQRLLTTGRHTIMGPEHPKYPATRIFNAGVGGDRVVNVIYRLTAPSPSLLDLLATVPGSPRHVFLMMGANDLEGDRRAISDETVAAYACVIESMRRLRARADADTDATPTRLNVVVCGLTPRRRVKRGSEGIVRESNDKLEQMVQLFAQPPSPTVSEPDLDPSKPKFIVEFLPSDPDIVDHLEDDGVHLNVQGYEIFAASLWRKYQELRQRDGDL